MFPSPSLGPPWLSLSASPAFAPWGIPEELDPEELEPPELDDPELLELVAGGDEDVELDEADEPPPQPATNTAISTSVATSAAGRRGESNKALMSYLFAGWCLSSGGRSACSFRWREWVILPRRRIARVAASGRDGTDRLDVPVAVTRAAVVVAVGIAGVRPL
jgi:hypothetical protein